MVSHINMLTSQTCLYIGSHTNCSKTVTMNDNWLLNCHPLKLHCHPSLFKAHFINDFETHQEKFQASQHMSFVFNFYFLLMISSFSIDLYFLIGFPLLSMVPSPSVVVTHL